MITDAEFDRWLLQSYAQRCVLLEVDVWSGGSVVTRYLSTHGFISYPTDTPANTAYDEILLQIPRFSVSMSEQLRGYSQPASGDIVIDNSNGVRDGWLLDAWDGRPFRLYLGDVGWQKSDYRLMVSGVVADISAQDSNRLALKCRDNQHLLSRQVCTNLVVGAGSTASARLPVCYGECYNVEPILIDAATRTYAVHDGTIQAVSAVYESGAAKSFTANLAAGTFTLSAAAQGRVTADVKGSKTGGVYIDKTADIVQRILIERASLLASSIDTAAISAFNASVPGTVGIYLQDGTVASALDQLVIGAGGYYSFDRSGLFYLDQLKVPSGSPVAVLYADDVHSIALTARWLPSKTVRLAYRRQWTPQTDGLASSVSDARRAELSQPYLIAKSVNSIPQHLLAEEPPVESSVFVNSGDASAEANRRAVLFSQIRRLFQVSCSLGPARVKLGDVVEINLGRFGLVNTLARVVGIDESLTERRIDLTLFV